MILCHIWLPDQIRALYTLFEIFYHIIDLKLVKQVNPPKNSTWPYLNGITRHFLYELNTKVYEVICIHVFHFKLIRFHFKNGVKHPYYTTLQLIFSVHAIIMASRTMQVTNREGIHFLCITSNPSNLLSSFKNTFNYSYKCLWLVGRGFSEPYPWRF